MVVYHIGHFGALSKALMIHLTLHRKEKCAFLIDTTLCNHESREFLSGFASRAAEFASVVVYSDREFIDETGLDSIKKHVNSYFSELLRKNGIDLKKAEKIYTMFDTFNAFGAFALMNNIPLVFVDVFGVMAKDRYKPRGSQWAFYDELLKDVGALGYGCKNKNCVFLSGRGKSILRRCAWGWIAEQSKFCSNFTVLTPWKAGNCAICSSFLRVGLWPTKR